MPTKRVARGRFRPGVAQTSDPLGDEEIDGKPIMLRLTRADRARLDALAKRPPWSEAPFFGRVAILARACVRFTLPHAEAAPDLVRRKATSRKGP